MKKLTVIKATTKRIGTSMAWLCRCECGLKIERSGYELRARKVSSCGRPGCKPGTSHGLSKKSRAYVRWYLMRDRCYNKKRDNYASYGGKGIKVCARWAIFENFLADMGEPTANSVLDRIDNSRDYSPENCRWATFQQSTENRRNTVWMGAERVKDFAKRVGLPWTRVYQRLARGWTMQEIEAHPTCVYNG